MPRYRLDQALEPTQEMYLPTPRIAIIGDTSIVGDELTGAGAIAVELAAGWKGHVEVGFRSVADSPEAWEALDSRFGTHGVTTWLSIRPEQASAPVAAATIAMGDQLNIDELFGHDLVVVASRDTALRRFLADLPVHTHPGVRILALIHVDGGPIANEAMEDLTRFDMVIGAEVDYLSLVGDEQSSASNALELLAPAIKGTNVRAAISWGKHGAFRCLTPGEPVLTLPAHHAPPTDSDAPWAAFVAAVAIGVANRRSWRELGHDASRRFAIRAQELRTDSR